MPWNGEQQKTYIAKTLLSRLVPGRNVGINAPTLPSTALLSVISKIETPTAQDFFMLCWFVGKQLHAAVAHTGIADIFFLHNQLFPGDTAIK